MRRLPIAHGSWLVLLLMILPSIISLRTLPVQQPCWGDISWGEISWSPDSKWLTVQTPKSVLIFSSADYSAQPRILWGTSWSFAYSPTGKILAIAYGDHVGLYNPASG